MRSFRKLAVSLVLVAHLGYATAQSVPLKSATPSSSDFIDAFRQGHDHRDLPAMLKLFCWDRVTPEIRKMTEDSLKESFDAKISAIQVSSEHPKGRMNQYIRDRVTYGMNLPVVMELVVDNQAPASTDKITGYYPLGIKDGHYLIAVMAPIPRAALPPAGAPTPPAAK